MNNHTINFKHNEIQEFAPSCLYIWIAVSQREDSCNVVNWIQKIVLHCSVLVIAVQQSVWLDCCEVDTENSIALCCAVNSDISTAESG